MRYRILTTEFGQWEAQRLTGSWPFRYWGTIGTGHSRDYVLTMVEADKMREHRRRQCEKTAEEV